LTVQLSSFETPPAVDLWYKSACFSALALGSDAEPEEIRDDHDIQSGAWHSFDPDVELLVRTVLKRDRSRADEKSHAEA